MLPDIQRLLSYTADPTAGDHANKPINNKLSPNILFMCH